MNTATIARTAAARLPLGLPSGLLRLIGRALAPAAPQTARLDSHATLWIARPQGRTVTCESGTLWLTFDNEPADVILEAGESHRCTKGSRLAIHALATARVSVR
jgi:Protein of unknown function (DUF2917)